METVRVDRLQHAYGGCVALDGVSFAASAGECLGLLGPNGSGKTTLFRILSTLLRPRDGNAAVCGHDVVEHRSAVRRLIGVVFQSPSLDPHLSVRENLRHAGHLFGLCGPELAARIDDGLSRLGVADRATDRVNTLSGGLKRRVEIAKCLLHRPAVLLLDEAATGLDPAARRSLAAELDRLRGDFGVTIVLTTHLLDEADRCDRLVILDRGRVVAEGAPDELKRRLGGDCVRIECDDPAALRDRAAARFACDARVIDGGVRIENVRDPRLVGDLMAAFPDDIGALSVGKPTLEDVFIHETGRRFDPTSVGNGRAADSGGRA